MYFVYYLFILYVVITKSLIIFMLYIIYFYCIYRRYVMHFSDAYVCILSSINIYPSIVTFT